MTHDQHATDEIEKPKLIHRSHKRSESMCNQPDNMPPPMMSNQLIAGILRDISERMEPDTEEEEDEVMQPGAVDMVNRFIYLSDDSETEEEDEPEPLTDDQIRIVTRNATTALLSNIKATLRFMRVDVHNQEAAAGVTATTASMRTRIEDMETMIDRFEDNTLINPRRLFD